MGSPVVEFERVSKAFAGKSALNDLSFEVPSQSIYGFIGPNGSGKTTTLRVMLHLLRPDSGQVEVLGIGAGGLPMIASAIFPRNEDCTGR